MARRSMTGQLNMFDLFRSLDEAEPGEVQMVSLVPEFEDEPEEPKESKVVEPSVVEDEPEEPEMVELPEVKMPTTEDEKVAMSRVYEKDGIRIEIAYINYNKVRITRGSAAPIVTEFASSKEAVDYYVEQMQEYEADE